MPYLTDNELPLIVIGNKRLTAILRPEGKTDLAIASAGVAITMSNLTICQLREIQSQFGALIDCICKDLPDEAILPPGTPIKTAKLLKNHGWTASASAQRIPQTLGKVIRHNGGNGHGDFYHVEHWDGSLAAYDRSEIEVCYE